MATTYYNEHDPFAAEWLGNLGHQGLIPEGFIDARDIQRVDPEEVAGYVQCHFFAGIGGWPAALALAGWPIDRPVWTGSCPCQPFSVAGKKRGEADERHLWPEFFRLIRECRPATIFGEQVASPDGLRWLDGVFADLESVDYACGAVDLPAACVKAPHGRQRLCWVANTECAESRQVGRDRPSVGGFPNGVADTSGSECGRWSEPTGECGGALHATDRSGISGLEYSAGDGREQGRSQSGGRGIASGCGVGGLVNANGRGSPSRGTASQADGYGDSSDSASRWASFVIVERSDGKICRISSQPGDEPLAYGIPRGLGRRKSRLRRMADRARTNRVGRLRGYGNAIVPDVAAEFVRAFLEAEAK